MIDKSRLLHHVSRVLYRNGMAGASGAPDDSLPASSVLMPLVSASGSGGPCLVLNKRSQRVRQPGDLCFPGGGAELPLDRILAGALLLPGSPLRRWGYFRPWVRHHRRHTSAMALNLATALRESFEEMRLNPLFLRFLGPLPEQRLIMFRRAIHPMVVSVEREHRYRLNWEVERLVFIPLEKLLDGRHYCTYHMVYAVDVARRLGKPHQDFPAFRFEHGRHTDILWGVTFRIVASFLELVFDFHIPPPDARPAVEGRLDAGYYTGRRS